MRYTHLRKENLKGEWSSIYKERLEKQIEGDSKFQVGLNLNTTKTENKREIYTSSNYQDVIIDYLNDPKKNQKICC